MVEHDGRGIWGDYNFISRSKSVAEPASASCGRSLPLALHDIIIVITVRIP